MKISYWLTLTLVVLLAALCVAWELKLAPVRSGGSWLVLKALPLLLLWPGLLHGKRRTFQLASLLIWAYFTEGVTRAWSEKGLAAQLAGMEVALSLLLFVSVVWYCRAGRPATAEKTTT